MRKISNLNICWKSVLSFHVKCVQKPAMPTNFRGGEDLQDAVRSSPDLHYFTLVEELKSDNCYAVCYAVSSGWSTVKLVVAKVWSEAEKSLECGSRCFKRCYSNFLPSDFPDLQYIDFIPFQIDAFDALHDPTCTVETDVILLEGCSAAVWNRQS